jgi:hypothetical protein
MRKVTRLWYFFILNTPTSAKLLPGMGTARWHFSENMCEVSSYQGANIIPRIIGRGPRLGLNVGPPRVAGLSNSGDRTAIPLGEFAFFLLQRNEKKMADELWI